MACNIFNKHLLKNIYYVQVLNWLKFRIFNLMPLLINCWNDFKTGKIVGLCAELNILINNLKAITMKKFLLSAVVLVGAMGICVTNFGNTNSIRPVNTQTYNLRDTVPSDTTMPKDSVLLLKK